jgi:hypothetical protein
MAGKVVVSTLNNDTGVLATQNGMTGIPKAWVNWNGSTGSINSAFNVGSITKNGTGDYTLNFTTTLANANYAVALGQVGYATSNYSTFLFIKPNATMTPALKTTTQLQVTYAGSGGATYDAIDINVAIFGA